MVKSGHFLLAMAGALFAVIILLSLSADITEDVQADIACSSTYTYVQNTTYPGGICCRTTNFTAGACGLAADRQAFTLGGNTTLAGQEGMVSLANQIPNIGKLTGVVFLLAIVVLLAAIVRRR